MIYLKCRISPIAYYAKKALHLCKAYDYSCSCVGQTGCPGCFAGFDRAAQTQVWPAVMAGVAYHLEEVWVNTKKDHPFEMVFFVMVLWRLPTLPGLIQVSSAVLGLTSLFGMGRGEHQANSHQQDLWVINFEWGNDRIFNSVRCCELFNHSFIVSFNIEFHVILEVEENKIKKI